MAFMMPVMKNDYNIYASSPSSRGGSGTPQQSRGTSLSSSPTDSILGSQRNSILSSPRNSISPRDSHTPAFTGTAKSELSLHKFHSKVLDKLRKVFRNKDASGSSDDVHQPSNSSISIR